MGQAPSNPSSQVERESRGSVTVDESLRQGRPDQHSLEEGELREEEEPVYYPHASNFQQSDPKSRQVPTEPRSCRRLTLGRLKYFGHRPARLVLAVRRYIQPRKSKLTNVQEEAIRKWGEIDILNYRDQFQHVPIQQLLEKYFHIFDDLFFQGTLENHVRIFASETPVSIAGCQGHTSHDSDTHTQVKRGATVNCIFPKSTITLYAREEPNFGEMMEHSFGTLVHEMCHAFFYIYGCIGKCCDNGSLELGKGGHGLMFQEMAYDIETMAASKSVLGFDLDLGRYYSLLHEIHHVPNWKDQMDVSRWGFDEEKLTNDLIIFNTRGLDYVPYEKQKPTRDGGHRGVIAQI
ncbi:hypothetical protein NHQ30_009447 [Ciborinia camelliae]|nr:hypothetical protein NHQ30_009447 [Ciborinia camelliae]